jgi:hypothetical protein
MQIGDYIGAGARGWRRVAAPEAIGSVVDADAREFGNAS